MGFVVSLRACEFDSVWSSLSRWLGKRYLPPPPPPPSASRFPLLVADRRSGHICVLVWFRLGVLVFILIPVLCGVPDRLSSDCFWAHL